MSHSLRGSWVPRSTGGVVLVVGVTSVAGLVFPSTVGIRIATEHGFIEVLSSVLLGIAAILALVQSCHRCFLPWLSGAVLSTWSCLRELDFQKRLTYRSVESIGYYTRPGAPWTEKIVVLLVLIPFGIAGCHVLWLAFKHLRLGLILRKPWAVDTVVSVALMIVGILSEKLLSLTVVEECCELGLAAMVLLIVLDLRIQSGQPNAGA